MSWDAEDLALLKKLWASGQSAAQIARRLGHSRNAVCAKLTRLGLKRGHKPPTAKPRIMPVPKPRPASLAACSRPAAKVMSPRQSLARRPKASEKVSENDFNKELNKRQLYAMLAEAVRNTR